MARSKHFTRNPYAKMLYYGIRKLVESGNSFSEVQDLFEITDDDIDDLIEEYGEDYENGYGGNE